MLHSAVRPLAGRTACAACLLRRTAHSHPHPLPSRPRRAIPSAPQLASAPYGARGAATFAQPGAQVAEQGHDPEQAQDADTGTGDGEGRDEASAEQAMVNLIEEFAAEHARTSEVNTASSSSSSMPPDTASSDASSVSSDPAPSSLSSSSAVAAPSPADPPASQLTIKSLLTPSISPGGPTLDDLRALRPKRFIIPDASSLESHRLVYRKSWESAVARFDRAFNKRQLADFAGEYGLKLDLNEPRLRTGTPGRKPKFWKSKRIDQMTKRELIHAILVIEFHMVHPDTIPAPKTGPRMSETVALDDRTLFLLLSPKSRTIPNLTRQLGVQVAFRRNRKTGVVELVLNGTTSGVLSAKEELELLEHTCAQGVFSLPGPATTLRPEVYQAISRTAKAFLAPGPQPDKLLASAIEPKLIERAERLVNVAFATHAERTSTPLFASIPSNLESLKYAMYPFTPLTPLPTPSTGGTSLFARVKTLSLTADVALGADEGARAYSELLEWSERMRMERTARPALYVPPAQVASTPETSSVWKLLRAPFAADEHVALQARFGHVVWPLYRSRGEAAEENKTELGPAFSGVWAFSRFAQWAGYSLRKVKSVFIPAPPAALLQSTRVLTPLPVAPSPAPFASLLSPISDSAAIAQAAALEQTRQAEALAGPALESVVLRRWTYRATTAPNADAGEAPSRVEIDFELENEGEVPTVRDMRIASTEVRVVRESKADLMVPIGAQDAQFSMSSSTILSPNEYPPALDERAMTFHGAPPVRLSLAGESYILDTDRFVRRTLIPPPAPTPAPGGDSRAAEAEPQHVTVQEAWHSLARDGTRGTDVFLALGEGEVRALQDEGKWKAGLEAVERRCVGRVVGGVKDAARGRGPWVR